MDKIENVNAHYQEAHQNNETAWEFLANSNLSDKSTKAFDLGFAARSFGGALLDRQSAEGKRQRATLKQIGALRADSKPQLYGLTIPFKDTHGDVVDIYAHNFNAQKGAAIDLYLDSERKGFIWHGGELEIILVSHPMDALALFSIGIETENPLLQNVACCLNTADSDFRAKLSKVQKVYLGSKFDSDFSEFLADLDCEVYQIQTATLKSSFFEMLSKSPQNGRETITKIFQVPSLIGAPNAASDNLEWQNECVVKHDEVRGHYSLDFENRGYRVTGLAKNKGYDCFKIRLKVWDKSEDVLSHDDTLDLCAQKQRIRFAKDAAEALNENEADMKRELGKVLAQVEQIQEERLTTPAESKKVELSEKEREAAEKFLNSDKLLENISQNLEKIGILGESGLVAYLCGVSRLMDRPLSAICEESRLSQRVLSLFPAESIHNHTAISDKALFYGGMSKIENQILCLESVKKGGAITQLVKNGRISQLTAIKDSETGGMMAKDFSLECRPMLFLSQNDDEELEKLCLSLKGGVEEEKNDKKSAITLIAEEEEAAEVRKLHQNVQRLLQKWRVVNPFAADLTFPNRNLEQRSQYLRLIEAVTLLHQLQRERKTYKHGEKLYEYLEVTAEDVKAANKLAANVFCQSSIDELAANLQQTFRVCAEYVKSQKGEWDKVEFSKKDIFEKGGVKRSTLANHLKELTKCDFVDKVAGKNGVEMKFTLLVDPAALDGEPLSLVDPDSLAA